jgi:hypothetical protein
LFSYFTPHDIAAQLRALGFTGIEDHSAFELVAGYLDGSARSGDRPARAVRILRASR